MSTGLDLLRRLSSTTSSTPATIMPRASGAPSGAGELDFAQLLTKAQAGELSSGMTVRVSPHAGVELSPMQLARLSVAADRAEAQGATRAVALIDGQAVQMDVATRTVLGKADLSGAGTITNIDSVIVVPNEGDGVGVGTPARDLTKLSPSLLSVLRQSEEGRTSDRSPVG